MSDQNPDTIPPVEGVGPAEVHVIDLNDAMIPPDVPAVSAEDVLIARDIALAHALDYVDNLPPLPATPSVMENQCHAYSKTGQRCEHMAGHPGWHEVSFEWDDESCWVPGTVAVPPVPMADYLGVMLDSAGFNDHQIPPPEVSTPASEPAAVDHVTKEGTPVVYSTDVPDRLEVPDPNDPCVACEGCRRAHHPGGGKCVRCGQCPRYIPG